MEFYNDDLSFTFLPETDSAGRLKRLTKKDREGRVDELHFYRYRKDGSYSVEFIAHGTGMILFSEYNSVGDCTREIFSASDTVIYTCNALGKMAEIREMQDGLPVAVATTEFDASGYPVVTHISGYAPGVVRYKNNVPGLPEEMKLYTRSDTAETLESRVTLAYTFY